MGYYYGKGGHADRFGKNARRARKFAEALIMSGDKEKAKEIAGYAEDTDSSTVIARTSKVQQSIQEVAQKVGLTKEAVTGTIADRLQAEKLVVTKDGVEVVPDSMARLKAAELGLKVWGVVDQASKTSDAALDFCRAYWQAKAEAEAKESKVIDVTPEQS